MSTPSSPYCRLDLAPPLADRFIVGVAPIDCGPVLLLMPFGFHLAVDTLPSEVLRAVAPGPPWLCPAFAFVPVWAVSIPSALPGQRGITPAFGYSTPHLSARGTSTLPNIALLSTHYGLLRPLLAHPGSLRSPLTARYHLAQRRRGGLPRS